MKLLGLTGYTSWRKLQRTYYTDNDTNDKLKIELTVSKKGFKPMSVKYTCEQESPQITVKFKGNFKYSKQNSGVRVEVPSGISSAASK